MSNTDEHNHTQHHVHDPKEKKRQINRISRINGHLEYQEDDRYR